MKLILSGEGPTDLGSVQLVAGKWEFVPGPMAWIVDKILEVNYTAYSLLEVHQAGGNCVIYVGKRELISCRGEGPTLLPGFKYGKENAFFTRNAQCLALHAKKVSEEDSGIPVIAVLFRDGDGTNSKEEWSKKVESMRRGFAWQQFLTGVPMVPNPKSEAWMICALRNPPYTNCVSLEDQSGNDNSPNSLKDQLRALCGGSHPSAETQANWVKNGRVDPGRIDMPSFSVFKQDLHRAAQNAGLQAPSCP
jgi:hypothetical protein